MKLKIEETIEREVEINFPCYRKDNCHFYKVMSENKIVWCCNYESSLSLNSGTNIMLALREGKEESNEAEFLAEWGRVEIQLRLMV